MAENVSIGVTEVVNLVSITPTPISQTVDINVTDNTDDVVLNVENNIVQVNITKGLSASNVVTSVNSQVGDVTISKSTLGLSNVDNTSDVNKPISSATQTALNAKANTSDVTTSLALKADTTYVNTQLATKQNTLGFTPYNATNPSGFISAITQTMINEALGYIPYSTSNPSNYINSISSLMVTNALGFTPYSASNPSNYISGITSLMVTNALGYTPYNASNPSAFISLNSLSAGSGISYNNTTGQIASTITQYTNSDARNAITLTTNGTSGAATYTPSTGVLNIPSYAGGGGGGSGTVTSVALSAPTGFSVSGTPITTSGTLALAFSVGYSLPSDATQATWTAKQNALSGTGFVKSTAGVISYDTNTYLTGITSGQVTTALGFTPYNATNPNSYIALSALSSTATGLTYTNTTGVFSLTSGYAIPTTSSQTNWDTAYTNRITSLTTTGSSGSATLTTNTLNIPTYTLAGLGGQASSTNLTSLSGLTYASASFVKMTAAGTFTLDTNTYYLNSNPSGFTSNVGTVTSVAALTLGTTGTDVTSTVATGTTTPVITLNLPSASSLNRGLLTSADWSTFNSKQGTITLTTTGSSGASTFTTNTLNIPNYTLAGLGGQASSTNLTSLSGLTFASTSFVKMTAAGTFALDTNTYYLSSNPSGYTNNTGTVTSVGGTGTINGLTLTGTVTTTGNLTLGGTLDLTSPPTIGGTNANSGRFTTIQVTTGYYDIQPTPTAKTANATLTIAEIQGDIITVTSTTAVALTLPTGTLTDAGVLSGTLAVNGCFDWYVINLGSTSGAVTMNAGTAHTYVGNATVAINTSAQFRTRKTATNTFVTYRVG